MDTIFSSCLNFGKGIPDLSRTTDKSVILKIPAQIQDSQFILFLELIKKELHITLCVEEVLELEYIRKNKTAMTNLYISKFIELGIVERIGKRGRYQYILSKKYYSHIGKLGVYTKLKGLSRAKCKGLILQHIADNQKGRFVEFVDAFPDLPAKTIQNILQELKSSGKIEPVGTGKTSFWVLSSSKLV